MARLSPRQIEMLLVQLPPHSSMQSEHDGALVAQRYSAVCRDLAVEMASPFYGGLLFAAADAGAPVAETADAVLALLRKF